MREAQVRMFINNFLTCWSVVRISVALLATDQLVRFIAAHAEV